LGERATPWVMSLERRLSASAIVIPPCARFCAAAPAASNAIRSGL
jgi:hypothetical protein